MFRRSTRALRPRLLYPDGSFYCNWSLGMCMPLLYTATVTPYYVAMSGEDIPVAVYVLDRLVDLIFAVDILLSFSLAYRNPRTAGEIHVVK